MYVVSAPLAVIADAVGKKRYYYEGTVLPGDLPAAELARLAELGLISEIEQPAAADPGPGTGESAGSPEPGVQRPALVATKAAWVDYVVSRGMDRAAAEALTKQELIDASPAG